MPQLDKVTLFSQVFWLISLYFLFFLGYLHYYLPWFSKIFKVRSFFLTHSLSTKSLLENPFSHYTKTFSLILLTGVKFLPLALSAALKHYNSVLNILLFSFFKKANSIFLKRYLLNTVKLEVSKKVYF